MVKGFIVGADKMGQGFGVSYRVVLYERGANDNWNFKLKAVPEAELVRALSSGTVYLHNAGVKDGKLKGLTGSLNRFTDGLGNPLVIISEIKAEDKVLGYRVADRGGKISKTRAEDLLKYCDKVVKTHPDSVPIQNAIYVEGTGTTKAHIKTFPDQEFIVESIKRTRSAVAKPSQVDTASNDKKLSKIEEMFNKQQIYQLKLGKQRGVDIRVYGNPKLSAEQMEQLRKALEDGINPQAFADPAYSVDAMHSLRLNAKYGVDVTYFVNPKFNAQQIYELSTGYLSGVDISQYADPELSAKDMAKKRVYLECMLWNEVEAPKEN